MKRFLSVIFIAFLLAGCDAPEEGQVSSTSLTFKSYTPSTTKFDVQVRKGDSLCWQHGDEGTVVSTTWKSNQVTVLSIVKAPDHLEIICYNGMYTRIPIETATLIENPEIKNGKYHVGNYVQKLGVARSPNIALYIYVKEKE